MISDPLLAAQNGGPGCLSCGPNIFLVDETKLLKRAMPIEGPLLKVLEIRFFRFTIKGFRN